MRHTKRYYAIKWMQSDGKHHDIRIAEKCHSPVEAAKYCYGMVTSRDMYYKDLGTRVDQIRVQSWLHKQLKSEVGWVPFKINNRLGVL